MTDGVVLCSSSGWAHAVPTAPGVKKVVYCHNPARWLYQSGDFLSGHGRLGRSVLSITAPLLRWWDKRMAATADVYLVNSRVVADRVRQVYGIEAEVVHPPVLIDPQGLQQAVEGLPDGYFLAVGRGRGYKNSSIAEAAARQAGVPLVTVGDTARPSLDGNILRLGRVTDAELRWLYAHARALVSVSFEDFGLTPLEANAFGTPALLLRAGGFLDSLEEGVSGLYIDEASIESVAEAMTSFPEEWDREAIVKHAGKFSVDKFGEKVRAIVGSVEEGLQHASPSATTVECVRPPADVS